MLVPFSILMHSLLKGALYSRIPHYFWWLFSRVERWAKQSFNYCKKRAMACAQIEAKYFCFFSKVFKKLQWLAREMNKGLLAKWTCFLLINEDVTLVLGLRKVMTYCIYFFIIFFVIKNFRIMRKKINLVLYERKLISYHTYGNNFRIWWIYIKMWNKT